MRNDCRSYSIVSETNDPLSRHDESFPDLSLRGFKWNLQTFWPELKRWQ